MRALPLTQVFSVLVLGTLVSDLKGSHLTRSIKGMALVISCNYSSALLKLAVGFKKIK